MSNVYEAGEVAAFMRSKERYGDLSNMTGGMPILVNGIKFQSSEGLYQAFKYPDNPEAQRRIGAARSGMDAKKIAYAVNEPIIPEWNIIRIRAMRYALAQKLAQNPERFGNSLRETGNLFIVEMSYRDPFWGAQPQGSQFIGQNTLGCLLTELRWFLAEHGAEQGAQLYQDITDTRFLTINGQRVEPGRIG